MNAIAIIPARGGSKGVPRKNLCEVAGRPLIAFTAEVALSAQCLSRCILSTDDEEIAEVGRALGLDVPFLRPNELATDTTPSVDVMSHACRWLWEQEQCRPDIVVLLQPTSPLREPCDIDVAVTTLANSDADSIVSVCQVAAHYAPSWQLRIDQKGALTLLDGSDLRSIPTRRQDLPRTYWRNGAIYAVRESTLRQSHTLYGSRTLAYVMPQERSVNVDSTEDLLALERILMSHTDRA